MKRNSHCSVVLESEAIDNPPLVVVCGGEQELEFMNHILCGDPQTYPCSVYFVNVEHSFSFPFGELQEIRDKRNPLKTDMNRWYFIGLGKGATIGWSFLASCPRTFAAAILGGGDIPAIVGERFKFLPLTIINGSKEAEAPLQEIQASGGTLCSWVNANGPDTVLRSIDDHLISWLFSWNLDMRLEPHFLKTGLWNIESGRIESFFVVEGKDLACVIDTGMGRHPIVPLVSTLTHLPLCLAVTHAHVDHAFHADEFQKVFLGSEDMPLFDEMVGRRANKTYAKDVFVPLHPHDSIDLGGVQLRILFVPGHTPGSVAFVDDLHHCIFTGDAFGSGQGVLMALPHASTVSEYLFMLKRFIDDTKDISTYTLYGGHLIQGRNWEYIHQDLHPLSFTVIKDMVSLCEYVLQRDPRVMFERFPERDDGAHKAWTFSYRSACMWVWESQLQ